MRSLRYAGFPKNLAKKKKDFWGGITGSRLLAHEMSGFNRRQYFPFW